LVSAFVSRKGFQISLLILEGGYEPSGGLFIFAATFARFIEDWNVNNPEGQLACLMSMTYIAPDKTSPHQQLDKLYLEVLHEVFLASLETSRPDLRQL